MERREVQVYDGLLRVEQRLRLSAVEFGTDVSGPGCIYAAVRVRRGTVAYWRGDSCVAAPRRFAVFLPPFTVVQASLERCDVTSIAVAFRSRPSDELPNRPLLLADARSMPGSITEALDCARSAGVVAEIGRSFGAVPLAAKAKAILDRTYRTSHSIAQIAARLDSSHAVLSRAFRRSHGMAPVRYRHHLRVMDALFKLAEGAVPIEVFQDVGFDDLSRFYKVFRRVACGAPGSYRPSRSKSAKT